MALYPFENFITTVRTGWALKTKEFGKIGSDALQVTVLNQDITQSSNRPLINVDDPAYIESIVFTSNNKDVGINIYKKLKGGGEPYSVGDLLPQGLAMSYTPSNIVNNYSSMFEVNIYDEVNNLYKFTLKKPMAFPYGMRLDGVSQLTAAGRVSVRVIGVKHND